VVAHIPALALDQQVMKTFVFIFISFFFCFLISSSSSCSNSSSGQHSRPAGDKQVKGALQLLSNRSK